MCLFKAPSTLTRVNLKMEKFENAAHKMFSVHSNPGKFENDTFHRTLSYNASVGGGGGGKTTPLSTDKRGGAGGGRNSLCYTTENGVIAVPGNRMCAVAIEWLLRM